MKMRFATLAFASLLTLTACQQDASTPATPAGPAETIEQSAAQLQKGDLNALLKSVLPPEKYEQAKAEWKKNMAEDPASEEDRAKFAETMQKLTAPDAEQQLYAELEPQLAQMEQEMAAQMPLMVGMGRGFAMQSVQQNEQLSEAQKKQAGEVVDAVATWLQGVNFFDRELAKQAIAKVVATARKLDVKTLDQVEKMEFEQAMDKAGIALRGLFDVLAVYGFKIDETLSSVDAKVLNEAGDNAHLQVSYTLLGKPLSAETDMVKIGDRWYGKDAMAQIAKAEQAAEEAAQGDDADADDADADAGDAADMDAAPADSADETVDQ